MEKEIAEIRRHSNLATHAHYQRSTQGSRNARYKHCGTKSKNPQVTKPIPTSSVPSYVSIDTEKIVLRPQPPLLHRIAMKWKEFMVLVKACSNFASPSLYLMFHPGYGISGYHLMASIPGFTFPHPSYDEII